MPPPSIPEHEHQCSNMNGTSNYSSMHQITKMGAWFKDDISKTKLRRRFFCRPPWIRNKSSDSYSSVTSSVREILKGEMQPPSLSPSCASRVSLLADTCKYRAVHADVWTVQVNCVDSTYPGGVCSTKFLGNTKY